MRRLINFRLLLAVAVSIICGTVVCYHRPTIGDYGILILAGAFLSAFLLFGIIYKSTPVSKRVTISLLCFFLSLSAYGRFLLLADNFKETAAPEGEYTVTGTVKEISRSGNSTKIILKDCLYGGEKGGNLVACGDYSVDIGDKITLFGEIYPLPAEKDGKYSFYMLENTRVGGANMTLVSVDGSEGGIFNAVRSKIKSVILSGKEKSADIALAVAIGDSSRLNEEERSAFRLSGIAHIFAVSGMHVGLLFLALSFVFRSRKIRPWIKNPIIFLALIFYSGVCGFSASSLRASIMCGAYLLARSVGEKPDGVNAFSLSAIVVSAVNPADVLSIGFILSFTVSLSILIISPPIRRKTAFLGGKLSSAVAVMLSAELASFPLAVIYFKSFPMVALLSNLLLVPIVTIVYYALWIGIIINLALPFQSLGLVLPFIAFDGLYEASAFLSRGYTLNAFPLWCFPAYYGALLGYSDLVNVGKRAKRVCLAVIIAVIFICAILN